MISCLAVDDEPLALDLLEDNIRRIPFLRLVRRCRNAMETLAALREEPIDLMFLDIQMPGLTGIQLLQSLPYRPMVVFITAYEQYALTGFDLDVVDYLVKPVAFERFLKAANKALAQHQAQHLVQHPAPVHPPPTAPFVAPVEHVFVHQDYELVRVELRDILYVEGLKDYLKIHLTSQPRPMLTRFTMKAMEEKLPADRFMRVHKSFIVGLQHLTALRKGFLRIGGVQLPVGDAYREPLQKAFGGDPVG